MRRGLRDGRSTRYPGRPDASRAVVCFWQQVQTPPYVRLERPKPSIGRAAEGLRTPWSPRVHETSAAYSWVAMIGLSSVGGVCTCCQKHTDCPRRVRSAWIAGTAASRRPRLHHGAPELRRRGIEPVLHALGRWVGRSVPTRGNLAAKLVGANGRCLAVGWQELQPQANDVFMGYCGWNLGDTWTWPQGPPAA